MKSLLLAGAATIGLAAMPPAYGAVILTFGQTSGTPITATENGVQTATTITASDAPIAITQIENGVPVAAFLDLSLASTGAATPVGNGAAQHYAGTFSINALANNTGTNYLSGSFTDIVIGVGPGGALAAGSPPDIINFASAVITDLASPSAIGLGFANISPAFAIVGTSIGSFTSSVSGTFSASAAAVPEPAGLALMGVGLLGLAIVKRSRR
jgi:hypothetical protein